MLKEVKPERRSEIVCSCMFGHKAEGPRWVDRTHQSIGRAATVPAFNSKARKLVGDGGFTELLRMWPGSSSSTATSTTC